MRELFWAAIRSILSRAAARHVMTSLALATIYFIVPPADAASAAPAANGPRRVVTTPLAPFVLPETDPLAGFSIDVWNEVARLQSEIRGQGDLPGKKIAVAPGIPAADYLTRRGLPFTSVTTVDDAIRMLTQGEVQAVVLNAAVLQYLVAKRGNGMLQAVGPTFRPERIGIAVREDSPLRKRINQALLAIYEDGPTRTLTPSGFRAGTDKKGD